LGTHRHGPSLALGLAGCATLRLGGLRQEPYLSAT
jgi:hypothetical protein